MISILGVRMRQNVDIGLGSVSITIYRVTGSLLHSLVPKRNGSNDMVHGKCHSGYIRPCWLGNRHGSVWKCLESVNDAMGRYGCVQKASKHLYMVGTRV